MSIAKICKLVSYQAAWPILTIFPCMLMTFNVYLKSAPAG